MEPRMVNLTRVKDKFQITIPVALRTATALQLGDYLEATQFEDGILLRPQRLAGGAASKPKGIVDFLHETRSLSRTRQDIDASVADDRASWA
jgi:AbrB family looped-hinge helix DNA binding protein